MFHSDDYFSPGVTLVIIPESFKNLAQRVASVYHRPYLAGLNQLLDEQQVFWLALPDIMAISLPSFL